MTARERKRLLVCLGLVTVMFETLSVCFSDIMVMDCHLVRNQKRMIWWFLNFDIKLLNSDFITLVANRTEDGREQTEKDTSTVGDIIISIGSCKMMKSVDHGFVDAIWPRRERLRLAPIAWKPSEKTGNLVRNDEIGKVLNRASKWVLCLIKLKNKRSKHKDTQLDLRTLIAETNEISGENKSSNNHRHILVIVPPHPLRSIFSLFGSKTDYTSVFLYKSFASDSF